MAFAMHNTWPKTQKIGYLNYKLSSISYTVYFFQGYQVIDIPADNQ